MGSRTSSKSQSKSCIGSLELCQLPWSSESDSWAGPKRMSEQIQKDDLSRQQVLAAIFRQTRLDKYQCMTSEAKRIIYATLWAKQFRDDINSLKEFVEGDEFLWAQIEWIFEEGFFYMPKIFEHLI